MYVLKWKSKCDIYGRKGEYLTYSNGSYATKDIESALFLFSKKDIKNSYAMRYIKHLDIIKCNIIPEHHEFP